MALGWIVATLVAFAADPTLNGNDQDEVDSPDPSTMPAALADPGATPAALDPLATLQHAIGLRQAGQTTPARHELQQLLDLGPVLPRSVRLEALAYLGDILYGEQGPAAARSMFQALLDEEPMYELDSFRHPPDVCATFEALRAELAVRPLPVVVVTPTPTSSPPARWPAAVLLPGGVNYFRRGHPAAGLAVGAIQVVGAATSAVTVAQMVAINKRRVGQAAPSASNETGNDAVDATASKYATLQVINYTSGTLAWLAYLTPIMVETVRWGSKNRARVAVGATGIELRGSF